MTLKTHLQTFGGACPGMLNALCVVSPHSVTEEWEVALTTEIKTQTIWSTFQLTELWLMLEPSMRVNVLKWWSLGYSQALWEKRVTWSKRKNGRWRAGEMGQWVRALTALPKVLSSNSSNHIVAHNHLWWDLMPSSGVSEDSYHVLTYNNK